MIMAINCTLHRSEPAHFQCHECGSAFCDRCVSIRETGGYSGREKSYFCPACNVPLEMLNLGDIIEPFHNRLSAFFLYPFQPTPLILTAVLALVGALLHTSLLVNLAVWVVMMKYAYAVLTTTGRGNLQAPPVSLELINDDVMQVFKQYVIIAIAVVGAGFVASHTGLIGFWVYTVVLFLAIPSIVMLLVSTNSIFHAINPYYFIGLITRIGPPYFLMYLFLFFLLAGPSALFAYLPITLFPEKVYVFLTLFLKQFYAIISYHLMGYVLLQYHKKIGYEVDYDYFMEHQGGKKKRTKRKQEDELTVALAVLLKLGKHEEAIERLAPVINEENPSLDLSEKFLQLLKMTDQKKRYHRYMQRHLELLMAANKKQKALVLFEEMVTREKQVPKAEPLLEIAGWYRERNDFKKAINAYTLLVKQYKKHPVLPKAYFRLAKLLNEQGNNSSKAKQILQAILKHFPDHEVVPQVKKYLVTVG